MKPYRSSMYDEFRPQLERWCDEGLTIREMLNELPPGYCYDSLRNYIKRKELRPCMEISKRNVCDKCEYCKRFKNIAGTYNKGNDRICTLSWRMIQYTARYCPRWCEKGVEWVSKSK